MTALVETEDAFRPGGTLDRLTRLHVLPDGRRLAYLELGDPQGKPCLYCHGFPGSRLEPAILNVRGLKLISVDRPGYGRSDAHGSRTLESFAQDVAALADALGLARFSVIGVSGGAPYAAATAAKLGPRIAALGLICGLGPPIAPGMDSAHIRLLRFAGERWQGPSRTLLNVWRHIVLTSPPEEISSRLGIMSPKGSLEREALSPEFARLVVANWREGFRYSVDGVLGDGAVYATPWDFSLRDIKVPTLIWHGTDDRVVPVTIGHYYAAHIRHADARFPPGEGHFSLLRNHIDRMVAAIALAS
ncbi:MAG: alpha/beta hydrolase [Alphaproteobacteria bacterium]|nr:alpha/beta hydrolase [Alphaproteobacteria bacterium]